MNRRLVISVSAAAALALGGIGAAFAEVRIPHFNFAPTCRSSVTSSADCTKDEEFAQKMLTDAWPKFTMKNKKNCIAERKIDQTPSYVEFLTCLWMNENNANAAKTKPANSGTQ
jgi:rare lipoprotein A (peptidoglycan hydrolase)